MQIVDRLLSHRGGGRALDVGSGSGFTSVAMATGGFRVTAIDISPACALPERCGKLHDPVAACECSRPPAMTSRGPRASLYPVMTSRGPRASLYPVMFSQCHWVSNAVISMSAPSATSAAARLVAFATNPET
jgi:hypothetical protein